MEGNVAESGSGEKWEVLGKGGCGMEMMNLLPFDKSYLLSWSAQTAPLRHSKNILHWPQATKSCIIWARISPKGLFLSTVIISPFTIISIYIHRNNPLASLFKCYNQQRIQTHSGHAGKHIFHTAADLIPFLSQMVNFFLRHSASDFTWRHLK